MSFLGFNANKPKVVESTPLSPKKDETYLIHTLYLFATCYVLVVEKFRER